MEVSKFFLLISFVVVLSMSLVYAQEPHKDIEPSGSKYGPYSECQYLTWNGDEYCLFGIKGKVKYPTEELNKIKSKMLETISEEYFNKHFDLLMFKNGEAIFDYKIGGYIFAEVKDYGSRDPYIVYGYRVNANNLDQIMQPREITNVVEKDFLIKEARKCIGTKDVSYQIREGFTLFAFGNEPGGKTSYNSFEMNLETGEVSCWSVTQGQAVSGASGEGKEPPHTVPCYDCWKDNIHIAGIVIVAIILGIVWKIKKEK